MNCLEFWNNLPLGGRDLTEEQAGHLAECGTCAAQWRPHRSLAAGLQSMGQEWRKLQAPPRLEAGLTAAFRSQAGFQVRRSMGHSWWTPVFAWTTTAAAMLALAVVLIRGYQPAPARPGTVAAPRHTAQPLMQTAVAASDADSDDDASVLGDGFIRLPNAPRIGPNEDYNLVRVEVPGSAMIAMGVSVGEDRATETVVADVALGPDGTARAVRLVSDGGTF
jgi:hypothetical protein